VSTIVPITWRYATKASICPVSVDNYFRYKQLEVLNNYGFKLQDVANTVARFYKTSFGSWILKIEKIHFFNGKIVSVEDFEFKKIAGK